MDKIINIKIFDDFLEAIGDYIPKFIAFLVSVLIIHIIFRILLKVYYKFLTTKLKNDKAKVDTYFYIIRDAVRYVLYIIYIILFLQSLGVSPTVLITSLGALSVILGIAGQRIIIDIFNGFFVLFDNYYAIGDYIKVGEYEGYVEDFRIRSTFLRTFNNEVVIIPNSNVENIINYSKLNSFIYVNIPLSYEYNIETVETKVVTELLKKVESYEEVISIDYLGIDELNINSVQLKMLIYADPENRFIVKRILFKEYKILSEENNFKLPTSLINIEEKI